MAQALPTRDDDSMDEAVRAARAMKGSPSNVADNLQQAVDSSLRDQPLTTLAIAAALGFVLGALWKT